ncbi:hypothetical protein EMA8858_02566 [Emticicia aquatica]|uniref:Uncharacterized protein n=1 Tax=Emticicia aquatica TaxID=1681835 RepID=A0ABN8ETR2_9BACT|nr:hypothetical protein [Emticicia aquatica]CAH0996434.1 hypothetical protein EMA8858_02566 [Emticicia aquatica]
METAINQPITTEKSFSSTSKFLLEIPLYVYISVIASMCVILGILWDIAWHMSIGRDGLFSAPHVVVYVGAATAGIFSGYQVLKTSFWGTLVEKGKMVNFWGIFYSSLGGLFCIWGGIASLTSAPFDDWWHNTYGLDVEILSPPHTVLLLGLMSVQMGAMVAVLAFMNRKEAIVTLSASENANRFNRLQWLFITTAAFFITSIFTFLSEPLGRWAMHRPDFYQVASIAFPFILLATGRASGKKWGATYICLIFLFFHWVVNAVLRLLPAEPLLGPIHNKITTYQTLGFPLLLFIPAFAVDWLREKFSAMNDWILALILGFTYLFVLFVSHYPFGTFLHESPLARNWFWGSNSWSFQNDADWEYRFKFSPRNDISLSAWAEGMGFAILFSVVSSRIGLAWGNWMKQLQR